MVVSALKRRFRDEIILLGAAYGTEIRTELDQLGPPAYGAKPLEAFGLLRVR